MKIKSNFAVLGSLLIASVSANAAVTFGTSSAVTYTTTAVNTAGSQVFAYNADAAVGSTTEGGVTWTNFTSATLPADVTLFGGAATDDTTNGAGGAADLANDRVFGGASGLLSIAGLADGDYVLQMMMSDTRALGGTNNLTADFGATTAGGTADETISVGGTGGLITVEFNVTAGTTANVYLEQVTGVGTFSGGVSALQLRNVTVPEPSSTALLGLGGLALILRRRK